MKKARAMYIPAGGKQAVWGPVDHNVLPEGYPYKEEGWLEVQAETALSFTLESNTSLISAMEQVTFAFEIGEKYKVTWDGVSYIAECKERIDAGFAINYLGNFSVMGGDVDTGEPFAIYTMDGIPMCMYYCTTEGEHTVAIAKLGSVTHRINPDFLPEGYPYKAIETTALVENMSVTPGAGSVARTYEVDFEFENGQPYTIDWNGETYECIAVWIEGTVAVGNLSLMSGDDTGEPFCMNVIDGELYVRGTDSSTEVTLSIYGPAETIHPMAPEFLPALTSPNGTKYQLTVADDGTLSAVAVS